MKMLAIAAFVLSVVTPAVIQPQAVVPDMFGEAAKQIPVIAIMVWWSIRLNEISDARAAIRDKQFLASLANLSGRVDGLTRSVDQLIGQSKTQPSKDNHNQ